MQTILSKRNDHLILREKMNPHSQFQFPVDKSTSNRNDKDLLETLEDVDKVICDIK